MGMQIAPGAKLDDGLLEACVVEDRSVLARFRDARHLALGTVHRAPKMLVQGVRTAMIEGEGQIYFHLDGEPGVAHDRLSISIRPGALKVRVRSRRYTDQPWRPLDTTALHVSAIVKKLRA